MAFKKPPQTPEEHAQRDAEVAVALLRHSDRRAFGEKDSQGYTVRITRPPIVEPMGGQTHIQAQDEKGPVALMLVGDRSPDSLFAPPVEALSRALMEPKAGGIEATVLGVPERVNFGGKRDPNGQFRAIFVETMQFSAQGQTHDLGRPRAAPIEVKSAQILPFSPVHSASESHSEGADLQKQAAEDKTIFSDRRLRMMDFSLSSVESKNGEDAVFRARNERGPVTLVLPGSRGRDWQKDTAGQAVSAALADGNSVPVEATGFFRSQAGSKGSAWEFVVARMEASVKGERHRLGRDVAPQEPVHKISKRPRGRDDEAR